MKKSTYSSMKDLWMEFTVQVYNDDIKMDIPLCGLCGNTGIVDTLNSAVSPAGVKCGIKAFCICPNGRVKRKTWKGSKYGESSDINKR